MATNSLTPGVGSTGGTTSPTIPSAAPTLILLGGCAAASVWVAAQILAAHYGYDASLGQPAFAPTLRQQAACRIVAYALAIGAAVLLVRVGRARVWAPGVALTLALAGGVAAVATRGPLYGAMQGLLWATQLQHLQRDSSPQPAPGRAAASTVAHGPCAPIRSYPRGSGRPVSYHHQFTINCAPARALPVVQSSSLGPAGASVPPRVLTAEQANANAGARVYWLGLAGSFVGLLPLALAARPPRRRRLPTASHGTAAWGTGDAMRGTLALAPGRLDTTVDPPAGLLLGRPLDERRTPAAGNAVTRRFLRGGRSGAPVPSMPVLRYRGDGHLITIAPTRTGKGVSIIVPNLLTYPGSIVVSDPKGENYLLTHRRRREAKQHVWALDPFEITDAEQHAHGVNGSINPLDIIDARSVDAPDDASLLADMLTLPEETSGGGGDSHFEPEGRALLSALILYVAAIETGSRRSLLRVRELLTLPPEEFTQLLTKMRNCGTTEEVERLGHAGTLIARGAARLQSKADKERSGVVSTAQRCTHFLDSKRMANVLGDTTVPLEHLRAGRLSLYLILPTERLSTYRAWMRLMIGVCLRTMVHQGAGEAVAGPRGGPRVLFTLDEFANLKRLAPVEDAFTIAAGYGVTFWLFLQDLAQLKKEYKDSWATFLANADVTQTFGTNDVDTSEYLSKMTGDATILVEGENLSASVSHGRQGSRQESNSQSLSEKGRRLLTPDEVRRLPPDEALVFLRSQSPLRIRKLHYAHDTVFAGLYDRTSPEAAAVTHTPPTPDDGSDAGGPAHATESDDEAETPPASGAATEAPVELLSS